MTAPTMTRFRLDFHAAATTSAVASAMLAQVIPFATFFRAFIEFLPPILQSKVRTTNNCVRLAADPSIHCTYR